MHDSVARTLRQYIDIRFDQFADTSLRDLSAPSAAFCTMPPDFTAFLGRHTEAASYWLDRSLQTTAIHPAEEPVGRFVDQMSAFLQRKNQFIILGEKERADLAELYGAFLVDFRDMLRLSPPPAQLPTYLEPILARHQADLERFVADLAQTLGAGFVFSEPVCSEYSAGLQLSILHAAPERLSEPILDLGCGPHAHLVRYLVSQGKLALGVDRAPLPADFTLSADWLSYDLGLGSWGTIVSHMAFSNHFLHHHLRSDGQPESYARRYMHILAALKPGGSFFYTPGLPFIEDLLPADRYRVTRFPLPALAANPLADDLAARYGLHVLYASQITRLR